MRAHLCRGVVTRGAQPTCCGFLVEPGNGPNMAKFPACVVSFAFVRGFRGLGCMWTGVHSNLAHQLWQEACHRKSCAVMETVQCSAVK
jgi:hypothetical protein